jgi:glycosyltransferase involved in cell wall biosynthesis
VTQPLFTLVYPTRHRPDFIRQALRILAQQRHDRFEVVVCDNYVDPALSCEQACRDSGLANVVYVRPPRPLGMVENWNHALQFATGTYVSYLTDKMFVLPDALADIEWAIGSSVEPEIVTWTSDTFNPYSFADYFGGGRYMTTSGHRDRTVRPYSPKMDLDRRGNADVSRTEQSPADYCRGKIVFGAYHMDLIQRIVSRYGALFYNISPDYTSMVLGLSEARSAVDLCWSCVVSVNTDISNGHLCDTDDVAALAFLDSLAGGSASILPNLLVPGLYVSLHNWVAHDYLTLRNRFHLPFEFNAVNWTTYVFEDIQRPDRSWSSARVETEQKAILAAHLEALEPDTAAAVKARIMMRAARPQPRRPGTLLQRAWQRFAPERVRQMRRDAWQRVAPGRALDAPSIEVAIRRRARA